MLVLVSFERYGVSHMRDFFYDDDYAYDDYDDINEDNNDTDANKNS